MVSCGTISCSTCHVVLGFDEATATRMLEDAELEALETYLRSL